MRLCRDNGSPTYAAIVAALVDRLDDDTAAAAILRADGGDPTGTAMYLRLLGAVHRLALAEEDCPLRPYFPSTGGTVDPDGAVPPFFAFVDERRADVAAAMAAPVQTNEVGRSAPLGAAVGWVVDRLGGPVRLLEIGASAGLNLSLDRYRIEADNVAWGPPDAEVRLAVELTGGVPPTPSYEVVERRGCDPRPLDPANPGARLLLRSFVWPEHLERLACLDAALRTAVPVAVEQAEAGPWLEERLADLPGDATTIVFHSIVLQYMADDDRHRLARVIRAAGRGTDARRRLAWVRLEPTAEYEDVVLAAELWPGGERWTLATATPHGLTVRWEPRRLPA